MELNLGETVLDKPEIDIKVFKSSFEDLELTAAGPQPAKHTVSHLNR